MSYDEATLTRLREESAQIMGRYPSGHERSALIPMLHLIQSYDGYVSPDGIRFCAETLNLTTSEVSAVATFYSQFRRHPCPLTTSPSPRDGLPPRMPPSA